MNADRVETVEVHDVRFPTSRTLAGSDALNLDPDYSATYVVVRTKDGSEGYGLAFTQGRGNELCCAAVESLKHHLVGRTLAEFQESSAAVARAIVHDTQIRWLGPEKGVVHMAAGAMLNAMWDLWARSAEKPLWRLLVDMEPEQLVGAVDFTYLTDAITPDQALELATRHRADLEVRAAAMRAEGLPAYTTSAGWLGYSDEQMVELAQKALVDGFDAIKMKVGGAPDSDVRRAVLLRETIGDDCALMMDANQAWSVPEAIERMRALAEVRPWWIEEPTSCDDVLGHARIAQSVRPVLVATGENAANKVIFKQLLQADAVGVVQADACRVAGVNEVLAVLLLAAQFGKPVCPHAGGVGLCEYVQHLAAFDYLVLAGTTEGRVVEWVDHLHEMFTDPARVVAGRYRLPEQPGYSVQFTETAVRDHEFPHGRYWRDAR